MFRKASDFINLPVICLISGQQIALIKNLLLDASRDILVGFICEDNKFLDREKIKTIGKDAVMVDLSSTNELLEDFQSSISAPLFLPEHLVGTPIITKLGKSIGTIGDIVIENDTGKILNYEVSDGLLKDLVSGRNSIPVSQVVTYGEDTVVIK